MLVVMSATILNLFNSFQSSLKGEEYKYDWATLESIVVIIVIVIIIVIPMPIVAALFYAAFLLLLLLLTFIFRFSFFQ